MIRIKQLVCWMCVCIRAITFEQKDPDPTGGEASEKWKGQMNSWFNETSGTNHCTRVVVGRPLPNHSALLPFPLPVEVKTSEWLQKTAIV